MKKLLIYIAAFAMILAMNTSCEDMGSLEEHPKKVDATTFMANAKEVESVINSIYFQLRRDPGFSRYLIVLEAACFERSSYTISTSLPLYIKYSANAVPAYGAIYCNDADSLAVDDKTIE